MSLPAFRRTYKEIWGASEKPGGERNFFDYFLYRRASTCLMIAVRHFDFSPNVITSLSVCASLVAGYCFLNAMHGFVYFLGVLFMMISLVFDTLDGQYARYKGKGSEFGGWFDVISDSFKYIVLFVSLSVGFYLEPNFSEQWLSGLYSNAFDSSLRETILVMGMLIVSNFYMIYLIHGTRYKLSINPGTIVNYSGKDKKYFFGIESTLYTMFFVFLLFKQVVLLFGVLVVMLPAAWMYPFYLTYKQSKAL